MNIVKQTYCNWGNPKEKRREKIDTAFIRIKITPGEFNEIGSRNKLEEREFELNVYTSERTGEPHACISRVLTEAEEDACDGSIEPPENYT